MNITVVLADDHAVVRDGLRMLLEAESDINVVGDAADGRTAVQLVEEHHSARGGCTAFFLRAWRA